MKNRFFILNGSVEETENFSGIVNYQAESEFRMDQYMWFCRGKIPLYNENIQWVREQLAEFQILIPDIIQDPVELKRLIQRTIHKNKLFLSGLIHMSFFVINNQAETIMTFYRSEASAFEPSRHKQLFGFSELKKYSANPFNRFEFYNTGFWKAASRSTDRKNTNEIIILNEQDEITEVPGANIYFIKEKALITPSTETGCYVDTLRNKILETASMLDMKIIETRRLNPQHVPDMDEAFVAGEKKGLVNILGINNKRFKHNQTGLLCRKLNEMLLAD